MAPPVRPRFIDRPEDYDTVCGPFAVGVITGHPYPVVYDLCQEAEKLYDIHADMEMGMSLPGIALALERLGYRCDWNYPYGTDIKCWRRELWHPHSAWRPNPDYIERKSTKTWVDTTLNAPGVTYLVANEAHYMVIKDKLIYDAWEVAEPRVHYSHNQASHELMAWAEITRI